ncbi:YhdP family protein [Aliikangiella sp. IMCC44359]|uniref:YhdP family protein n=1 Tax=Aliikangiella sp. IMCC44359 TaxID=3459125 RepID=UPI00403A7FD4
MNEKTNRPIYKAFVYFINKLWLLIATVVIFTAVCFALLHLLLPQINYFKSDIEAWVENQYQVDIEMESIHAEWSSNGPILSMSKFKVKSDTRQLSLLSVDSMLIHLDGIATLFSGSLTTEKIEVVGANLNFILDRKLGVKFDSLEDVENSSEDKEFQSISKLLLVNLFNQKNLLLIDSKIQIETLSGREFNYSINELSIANYDQIHQISGTLEDKFEGRIKLVAEIFGDPSTANSYTNFYLEGKNILLSNLPGYKKNSRFKPESGLLNWQVWSERRKGRWQVANGKLNLNEVVWSDNLEGKENKASANPNIEAFSLNFNWHFSDINTGVLSLYDTQLKQYNLSATQLPELYFLFTQKNNSDIQWDFITRDFQATHLSNYFNLIFGIGKKEIDFSNSNMNLKLEQLGIRMQRENTNWATQAYASFSELSYDKSFDMPIIKGLSGELSYSNGVGEAKLKGQQAVLDFNGLFRNKLKFDELSIDLGWELDTQNNIDLLIESAQFKNSHLTLDARSRFFFQDEKPIFSLFAQLQDVDVSSKSLYLPTKIMSKSLTDYLDKGVKQGYIPIAKAIVHGPINSFPFDNLEGLFSIKAELRDAKYQYLPDWPIAEHLDANLWFEGNGMDLRALKATANGVYLNQARAVINDFSAKNIPLELSIKATSIDNVGREFLLQTPLNDIAKSLEVIDYQGNIFTHISLVAGLDDGDLIKLDGKVSPDKEHSKVNISDFQFTELEGDLLIDANGVKQSEISAKYHDKPVKVFLSSGEGADVAHLNINATGRYSAEAIGDILDADWITLASGETEITANIQVGPPKNRSAVTMTFMSDLEGLAINLPDQLKKSSNDKSPIEIELELAEVNHAKITWNDLKAKWWWKNEQSKYQHIGGSFLYHSEKSLPEKLITKNQTNVHLETMTLKDWLPIFSLIKSDIDRSNNTTVLENELKFTVGEVKSDLAKLTDLDVFVKNDESNNWELSAQSPSGNAQLKFNQTAPWELEINNLNLKLNPALFSQEQENTAVVKSTTNQNMTLSENNLLFNLHDWPKIDLRCNHCVVHNKKTGNVRANIVPSQDALNVQGRIEDDKNHQLAFNANWLQIKSYRTTNQQQENNPKTPELIVSNLTHIEYDLSIDKVGELMKRWDYPVPVRDSNGQFSGRLWWRDMPWKFSTKAFEGDAKFSLGTGYLSEVSDAKVRLFSLLSLQTLSRRLQLDFSDVYKKGFFYDQLSGNVRVRDGIVIADNIYVDGSAAKVTLNGEVNLQQQTIEQRALVVPQLTSSLPVLIGWAVEPTTGVIIYLLNKIFEPAIEVVTQIEYRLHGPLDKMNIDEIKKFKNKVKYKATENDEQTKDETRQVTPSED